MHRVRKKGHAVAYNPDNPFQNNKKGISAYIQDGHLCAAFIAAFSVTAVQWLWHIVYGILFDVFQDNLPLQPFRQQRRLILFDEDLARLPLPYQ